MEEIIDISTHTGGLGNKSMNHLAAEILRERLNYAMHWQEVNPQMEVNGHFYSAQQIIHACTHIANCLILQEDETRKRIAEHIFNMTPEQKRQASLALLMVLSDDEDDDGGDSILNKVDSVSSDKYTKDAHENEE